VLKAVHKRLEMEETEAYAAEGEEASEMRSQQEGVELRNVSPAAKHPAIRAF